MATFCHRIKEPAREPLSTPRGLVVVSYTVSRWDKIQKLYVRSDSKTHAV